MGIFPFYLGPFFLFVSIVQAVYDKEDCAAFRGTCVPYAECPNHIGACNSPHHYVCCTSKGVVGPGATVQPPIVVIPPVVEGGDKINGPGCGISSIDSTDRIRVVNGTNANYGELPWQVSLVPVNAWGSKGRHMCGGVLIHPQWVLTAAHCVQNNLVPNQWVIRLGNLYNSRKDLYEVESKVSRVIKHERFSMQTVDYDIALLKLVGPVVTNDYINFACLPEANDDFEGQLCVAAGWGRIRSQGVTSDRLQKVELPIVNQEECAVKNGDVNKVTERMICAGVKAGLIGTCQGDSGGPLLCQKDDGRWQQIGITSWGVGCAAPNRPDVYTRVAAFTDWITYKMATN